MYYFKNDEVIQNDDDSDSEFLFQNIIEECVDVQETCENDISLGITEETEVKTTAEEDEEPMETEQTEPDIEKFSLNLEVGKEDIIGKLNDIFKP